MIFIHDCELCMQRLACGRRMYAVIITLYYHMGLRPQKDGGDDDDDRPTTNPTNKQFTNTQRNKHTGKQSSLPHTTNTILGLLHLRFFCPHFYCLRLITQLRQEASSARSLHPLFTENDRAQWSVAGALRGQCPVQPMKTLGSWPMTSLRGLWLGGRCEACGLCWR